MKSFCHHTLRLCVLFAPSPNTTYYDRHIVMKANKDNSGRLTPRYQSFYPKKLNIYCVTTPNISTQLAHAVNDVFEVRAGNIRLTLMF